MNKEQVQIGECQLNGGQRSLKLGQGFNLGSSSPGKFIGPYWDTHIIIWNGVIILQIVFIFNINTDVVN